MRRFVLVLLATIALLVGCDSNPSAGSRPEPPTLRATPQSGAVYVSIIGDAFTSGSLSGGKGSNGWPALVTAELQRENVTIVANVAARKGSGYGRHAAVGSVRFSEQVVQVVGRRDKLVILFGSAKDAYTPPENLATAVQRTLQKVAKTAPDAKILVIGPAYVQPNPPPEVLLARDVTKAQAEALGVAFVDPLAEGWFTSRPDLVGANGEDANDAGHVVMAQRIAPLVMQELRGVPTR